MASRSSPGILNVKFLSYSLILQVPYVSIVSISNEEIAKISLAMQEISGILPHMKREGQMTVTLDPEVKREIERLALADGRSVSNYVNRVLSQHVSEHTKERAA